MQMSLEKRKAKIGEKVLDFKGQVHTVIGLEEGNCVTIGKDQWILHEDYEVIVGDPSQYETDVKKIFGDSDFEKDIEKLSEIYAIMYKKYGREKVFDIFGEAINSEIAILTNENSVPCDCDDGFICENHLVN
jgi:hypothetical protein